MFSVPFVVGQWSSRRKNISAQWLVPSFVVGLLVLIDQNPILLLLNENLMRDKCGCSLVSIPIWICWKLKKKECSCS